MQYFGGKSRTCKAIATLIRSCSANRTSYVEPFVGAAWVAAEVPTRPAFLSDASPDLILLYQALARGWEPPATLSREEYAALKTAAPSALRAFAGFGCSFSGKWFGGYAKNARGDDYAGAARRSLLAKAPRLSGAVFECCDYREVRAANALIYCDPPYKGTTQYGAVGRFDSGEFWEKVREWSTNNTVLVSEYSAPEDFESVLAISTKTEIRGKTGRDSRVERVFRMKGSL